MQRLGSFVIEEEKVFAAIVAVLEMSKCPPSTFKGHKGEEQLKHTLLAIRVLTAAFQKR